MYIYILRLYTHIYIYVSTHIQLPFTHNIAKQKTNKKRRKMKKRQEKDAPNSK